MMGTSEVKTAITSLQGFK